MKLPITIEYTTGESQIYTAQPPEWMKWETKTGFTIGQAQEKMGISDLMFLAYHAMKRESAGKAVKPFEIWCEGVLDVKVGEADPKVMNAEV